MEIKSITEKLTAPYCTRRNLELVLGSKRRTLDYRISKLISDGVLERIKPGFYLNKKVLSETTKKEEMLEYVGSVLKYPSYVSLEYALSRYGMIAEGVFSVTYVTLKKTARYSCETVSFEYRNIKEKLFKGYEERFFSGERYMFAEKYKALFDFIYLTPLSSDDDLEELISGSRINWSQFSEKDRSRFGDACLESGSKKMKKAFEFLKDL